MEEAAAGGRWARCRAEVGGYLDRHSGSLAEVDVADGTCIEWLILRAALRCLCRHAGEQEGQGTWYGGGAQVWDEYEALQAPDEEEASTW